MKKTSKYARKRRHAKFDPLDGMSKMFSAIAAAQDRGTEHSIPGADFMDGLTSNEYENAERNCRTIVEWLKTGNKPDNGIDHLAYLNATLIRGFCRVSKIALGRCGPRINDHVDISTLGENEQEAFAAITSARGAMDAIIDRFTLDGTWNITSEESVDLEDGIDVCLTIHKASTVLQMDEAHKAAVAMRLFYERKRKAA